MNKEKCNLAPRGWRCSSDKGHKGPCPARPYTIWAKIKWWFIL